MLTIPNYTQVKAELESTYGDPQIAVFAHFEALLAIEPATHDLEQLTKVNDSCNTHIRSLVALGLEEPTFGQVFCPVILSKLPRFVKMELYRKNGSNKWTLPNLRALLKEEITARDKSERSVLSTSEGKKQGSPPKQWGQKQGVKGGTASALWSQGKKGPPTKSQSPKSQGGSAAAACPFCSGSHAPYRCTQFPDIKGRLEKARGLCSACLGKGHTTRHCQNRKPCYYCNRNNHHSSLCFEKFGHPQPTSNFSQGGMGGSGSAGTSQGNPPNTFGGSFSFPPQGSGATANFQLPPTGGRPGPQTAATISHQPGGYAVTKSALAIISGSTARTNAQLVFDDGSTLSFITPQKARSIGALPVGEGYTSLGRFGSSARKSIKWTAYEVIFHLPTGQSRTVILHEMGAICPPVQLIPLNPQQNPFLSQIPLAQPLLQSPIMANVDILIGLDYYYDFIGPEELRSPTGVVLLRSSLGYITSGFVRDGSNSVSSLHVSTMSSSLVGNQLLIFADPPDSDNIERLWEMEQVGIKDSQELSDDAVAMEFFNNTIRRDQSGRYEVRLPFKSPNPDLSDTYQLAFGRLRTQARRFQQDPPVLAQITQVFADQLEAGIIELASETFKSVEYYMPHHCVFDPTRESTKVRVVFDASAKTSKSDLSLNDSVFRGPVLLQDLIGILFRLRLHPVILSSDIAKAFHQVSLAPADRDATRFLWLKNPQLPVSSQNIQIYRFARVPFGINASPFLLAGTILHHLKQDKSKTADEILDNLYVDNVFAGKTSTQGALNFYHEAKGLFATAKMNLRQFYSNDPEFLAGIPESDRGTLSDAKVLGVQWDPTIDTFRPRVGNAGKNPGASKRSVLAALASVYDPCGWFSPVTVRAKILMQRIWKLKVDWDCGLPDDILVDWSKIHPDLQKVELHAIPRFHPHDPSGLVELHGFADASSKAYAAVVYLLVKSTTGTAVFLLFSKARVAPLKKMTIPLLELTGAWVAARLMRFIASQLQKPISRKFLWTDSTCVLGWIGSGSQLSSVYVRNRVTDIKLDPEIEFRHVPSEQNPADVASRGSDLETLLMDKLWWNGPEFLISGSWPKAPVSLRPVSEDGDAVLITQGQPVDTGPALESSTLIDLARCSKIPKLLRVTAYVFRFVFRSFTSSIIPLAVELDRARDFWHHHIQNVFLPKLLADVRRNSVVLLSNLSIFMGDDGLLRCKGRFQNANLPDATKFPILLPKRNRFTFLIILEVHERLFHAGVNHTLASLRSTYWVPQGRTEVKSALMECRLCRKLRGGPFRVPEPPPLPEFRVQQGHPFNNTGLDYLGPLYVKTGNATNKVWIALFTCASSRAIHLEVAASLSTSDFLLCLRRFVALYRRPRLICSDNAKQFHTADAVLQRAWKSAVESDEIAEFSNQNGITWKFTTDLAPWMGGFYERLVSPVKKCLRSALGRKLVSPEELHTLAYEISAVVNSRPLFHSGSGVDDFCITPAHLLSRNAERFPSFPGHDLGDAEEYAPRPTSSQILLEEWRAGQRVLDTFWQLWRDQYLLGLRQRESSTKQRDTQDMLPVTGQTVLVKDNLSRSSWRYGKIQSLRSGSDGKVRSVTVLVPSGRTIVRPLKLLYPLELGSTPSPPKPDLTPAQPAVQGTPRIPRAAAAEARGRIKAQLSA